MPTVVIAGGTSASLGRSLTTAITTLTTQWHVTILTRPSSKPLPSWLSALLTSTSTPTSSSTSTSTKAATTTQARVTLKHVDYANHSALVSALHGAHTVICVLGFTPASAAAGEWARAQIALLDAAVVAGVRRFAPAEFGVGVRGSGHLEALVGNLEVWRRCEEAVARARGGDDDGSSGSGGLQEWTRFECGLFMNYLAFGVGQGVDDGGDGDSGSKGDGAQTASRREQALGGRERDGEWFYYSTECRAELPVRADGAFPRITMTAIEDVGKFVAKSLDLPPGGWETTSYMVGETLAMDQVVRIAERVMGKKWEVTTVTPAELENRIRALEKEEGSEAAGRKMWAQLALCYTRDTEGEGWLEGRLNALFPDLKPLSVEAFLRKYYT